MILFAILMFILGLIGVIMTVRIWLIILYILGCLFIGFNVGMAGVIVIGIIGTIMGIISIANAKPSSKNINESSAAGDYNTATEVDYFSEGPKCLTCRHWGGNAPVLGCNFEPFRRVVGRCYCKGANNPHYYNSDRLAAEDGCDFWEMHLDLERLRNG